MYSDEDIQLRAVTLLESYNIAANHIRHYSLIPGRELAQISQSHRWKIENAGDMSEKLAVINACLNQLLKIIYHNLEELHNISLKNTTVVVFSKIEARARAILEYAKERIDTTKARYVALDSPAIRTMLSAAEHVSVSRRDCISAMKAAQKLMPSLKLGSRPGDGRRTMRLTLKAKDLPSINSDGNVSDAISHKYVSNNDTINIKEEPFFYDENRSIAKQKALEAMIGL